MKVLDLMTRDVVQCGIGDSAETAARLMWEHDVGSLPVIDVDGRVAGMVTDRDICMAAFTRGQPLREIPVVIPMSKELQWCHPDDDVEVAERSMAEHHVRRLPVVDRDGAPVGMLSLADLARTEPERPRATRILSKIVEAVTPGLRMT